MYRRFGQAAVQSVGGLSEEEVAFIEKLIKPNGFASAGSSGGDRGACMVWNPDIF